MSAIGIQFSIVRFGGRPAELLTCSYGQATIRYGDGSIEVVGSSQLFYVKVCDAEVNAHRLLASNRPQPQF